MRRQEVSRQVIRRLPKYYRFLTELENSGKQLVSSKELSVLMGRTASQIRQDFNCFGEFGQQGVGYNVSHMRKQLAEILGLVREYNIIIIGAGHIGQALAHYRGFNREGFVVKALFDIEPDKINNDTGVPVYHTLRLEEYIKANKTDIAVIAIYEEGAVDMACRLRAAGINHIWNFTPKDIILPGLHVENADLSDKLFLLSYSIRENAEKQQ